MSVDKVARSLIKYSELIDKNIAKYKDSGVPVDVYLHYSSLMTTIVEMLVEKKVTQSMKDKAINSIKFLGINDTDKILSKKGGVAPGIPTEGIIRQQIGDEIAELEIKQVKNEDTNDGCCVEYHLVGKIRKCFGEECKNLHFVKTDIDGRDFRDRIENWFYKTAAFKDLKHVLAKFINKHTGENKNELMDTCIKIVKSKAINIIENNPVVLENMIKNNIKIPPKPKPSFEITDKMNQMKLNELIKDKKVEKYMSDLEKYAGNMIDVLNSLM